VKNKSFKIVALITALSLLLPAFATAQVIGPASGSSPVAMAQGEDGQKPESEEAGPVKSLARDGSGATAPAPAEEKPAAPEKTVIDWDAALAKLHPTLRQLAQADGLELPAELGATSGSSQPVQVEGMAVSKDGDLSFLSPYFVKFAAQPPLPKGDFEGQIFFGEILPANLLKVASFGAVLSLNPIDIFKAEVEPYPADDAAAERPEPLSWEELRANADAVREGSLDWSAAKAFGDGRTEMLPLDWFEVLPDGPHKASAAWERGYTGEGIAISVIDDGVDFAHPDLMGTHKIYSGTDVFNPDLPSPYNGWPMIMDPFTMRAYFYQLYFGDTYITDGFEGVTYFDTSTVPDLVACGTGLWCFEYAPLIDYGVVGPAHTYVIADSMTASGEVHMGTHHDGSLRDYVWGERVAVLVTDPNTAGVYDTVYVDLDSDYDFRDEKPVTKADLADLENTYNNPVAYRDMNGDGLADLSGGLLYFIADGEHWPPAMEWLWYPDGYGFDPPGPGDLIAMHGPWDSGYSHGTQCASNAVAQGVVNGGLPEFRDLNGPPDAAVYGGAPDADMVAMNNGWYFSGRSNAYDAYILAAVGYDAIDQTGFHFFYGGGYEDHDAIAATSNSYGWSADFNDGYDVLGQYITALQTDWAPYLQFLFSTGNGGPGYGTVAPPSPGVGIAIGASTEYGSTGWDTITDTTQINFNDVAAFSNSGPGARDGAGVDVLAGGAYAAGAEEINYLAPSYYGMLDGNYAWSTWGGTSRSAPHALGILALIYQAYYDEHGVWPTHDVAKAIFMSSATDVQSDVYKQGAGSVNADRGTLVASGEYGVYLDGGSATWEPGDYRGDEFPLFAHLVYPEGTYDKEFTVVNDSEAEVTVEVRDVALSLVDSVEFDFVVTPEMVAAESVYGAGNRDNFYKAFNYFIPITATAGMDASWYNIAIPPETDLMVVRQVFPFDQYDVDADYDWDNRFYLMVYNWTDENNDGLVWDDSGTEAGSNNGVVNFINGTVAPIHDVDVELDWDDPRTELDRWEYGRFGYNRPSANSNELYVYDPLGRMHDGLFIGTRHLYDDGANLIPTTLSYRVEFYTKADVDWLTTDVSSLVVPAGDSAAFEGTVNVPADMPAGDYQAAIELYDAGTLEYDENTIVIPVALNVAAEYDGGSLTLGGMEAYEYDEDSQYNNGAMRGYFDWGWREESADWRFFYVDVDNEPVEELLWFESFEGDFPPAGWSVVTPAGVGWVQSNTGADGMYSAFYDDAIGTQNGWLVTPQFTPNAVSELAFWQLENWSGYYTYHGIWVSDGSGNPLDGDFAELVELGPGTEDTWEEVRIGLGAYAGQAIYVAFVYQGDWSDEWWIDAVAVTLAPPDYPMPPDAHVLVRDQWEGPAPYTDIDTVILGPTPSPLSSVSFGAWAANFYNPGVYGPYTLNTVAQSVDDRAGRSIWRFNTTSGANEEWLMFQLGSGGLHEILQHNILSQGDAFETVFTKTVGLLYEDEHSFEIETYLDEGVVGQVTFESTLDLNGLVADGYLGAMDTTVWTNEPVEFISSNTIEWVDIFEVTDGVNIEAWSSSADISDIDLYLYYYGPGGWEQRASSTSATADEYVMVTNPEDGFWFVGINNWSGPDGTFNLTRVVRSRVPGLTVSGASTDPVPAGTEVTLTIGYDYPMEPGLTYDGVVLVGPPEAPELKEIPISITRLRESAMVMKEVDLATAFPGLELNYTVDLFNLSDPEAYWEFSDPIPDDTEFVSVDGGCCTEEPIFFEDFEGDWPPEGWTVVVNGDPGGEWNTHVYWGDQNRTVPYGSGISADADSDNFGSAGGHMDTELWSPPIDLTAYGGAGLSFASNFQDMAGLGEAYLDVSTDSGSNWTNLFHQNTDDPSMTAGVLREFDLSAYAGETIILRWHYDDEDGWAWWWQIDNVSITALVCTDATYDEVENEVLYEGTVPLGSMFFPPADEGFEGGSIPRGWDMEHLGTGVEQWEVLNNAAYAHTGSYLASLWWDAVPWDEWLYSPFFEVGAAGDTTLSFWATSVVDPDWPDYYTMMLDVIDEDGMILDTLWSMAEDETWTWDGVNLPPYHQVSLDMSAYAGETVRVAWHGVGNAYFIFFLDDVALPGTPVALYDPSCVIEITTVISDTAEAGDWIVNTAELTAYHVLAHEDQMEGPVMAEAYTHIGMEEFAESYKEATAEVAAGGTIAYEIHVINSGDAVASVVLTDAIPAGTALSDWDDSPPYEHFGPNEAGDAVEWVGNIAPGEEWVFSFEVDVDDDPALLGSIIENTAYLSWNGETMPLMAETFVTGSRVYLPVVLR
jgi:uncharacterized repeat protein (TIGR01451 family)